jgi:hypothetical protein
MMEKQSGSRHEIDVEWITSDSGSYYLCPAAIVDFLEQFSEEELKTICAQPIRAQVN